MMAPTPPSQRPRRLLDQLADALRTRGQAPPRSGVRNFLRLAKETSFPTGTSARSPLLRSRSGSGSPRGSASHDPPGNHRGSPGPREGVLPHRCASPNSADDALHIAVATTQAVPYPMTWNCRHLANATMRPLIESACAGSGWKAPIICTPEELLETSS